jgi:hypothetical protein
MLVQEILPALADARVIHRRIVAVNGAHWLGQ